MVLPRTEHLTKVGEGGSWLPGSPCPFGLPLPTSAAPGAICICSWVVCQVRLLSDEWQMVRINARVCHTFLVCHEPNTETGVLPLRNFRSIYFPPQREASCAEL